jgi:hypothetical protein
LRADLLRAEAGVPPARRFAAEDGEGVVRSGPKCAPERDALSTFWAIDQLNRLSLVLAQGDLPPDEQELILASLPAELRDDFRSIVGQHRRYGRRRQLSRGAARELVRGITYIRGLVNRKPDRQAWTLVEMSEFDRVVELRATALGPSATCKIKKLIKSQICRRAGSCDDEGLIEIEFATRDDIHVLEGPAAPAYVRGIPERLDEWGAARHEVTLPTFRSWRTKLRKDGWLSATAARTAEASARQIDRMFGPLRRWLKTSSN